MALSTLLAGLRATRLGAVAAAAALATTSVVAAGATLPDQAADRAQEALDHAAGASADDDDDNGIDTTDIDDINDTGDDNGRSEDVIEVLGGGEFTPEDGQDFGHAVVERGREQEQGSFGQAVADAARGQDADDGDDHEANRPAVDLPQQAEQRGGNADTARP